MSQASLKILYFAWVRERVGKPQEWVDPPANAITIADLINWLSGRDEGYAHAFEQGRLIRAAMDQVHVSHDTPIAGAREIAFFPPMTGG